jgi:hypothetical protein
MIRNPGTSTERYAVPNQSAPGDSHLATKDRMTTNGSVVADLNEVIDFCSGSDRCRPDGTSIDTGVRTYINPTSEND